MVDLLELYLALWLDLQTDSRLDLVLGHLLAG